MAATDHTKLYKTQISQTEWLSAMDHGQAEAFRAEDNDKRERLRVLKQLIGMPYDQPYQFTARQVADESSEFVSFLAEHGDELCAMRLIPTSTALPKLRTRGASIRDSLVWFAEQGVDADSYRVDFVPHPASQRWATIFVVNEHGAFGEIVMGSHAQLTQGFYEAEPPIQFAWDFQTWKLTPANAAAQSHLEEIMAHLHVPAAGDREKLQTEFDSTFAHNYLCGYFETADSADTGLWFIDYNRILGHMYRNFRGAQTSEPAMGAVLLTGQAGSTGVARGRVRIINEITPGQRLDPDEILVCHMTTPDHLPLMKQAAAIVTDMGGVLSHAAIVARELKKPCLTATRTATTTLKDGQPIEVNADAGTVNEVV